ncbi:MAG: hypothetical protein ABMA26_20470 [Limisphaerales bacterium]
MHCALPLALALLAVAVGCGKQTGVATPSKSLNYTLDISGDKKVQNPSEAVIREAVLALDTKKGGAFLVVEVTKLTYIQTSGDGRVGFELEYQESDIRHHFRAKRRFTADEIVKVLTSYTTGVDDWKKAAEWELLKW